MTVKAASTNYEFASPNRMENYGGDINLYVRWEEHLMFACPSAYRAPIDMKLRDFLEQFVRADYSQHPEAAAIDWSKAEWHLDEKSWQPDLDKSLAENGVEHMAYMCFRTPGLTGLHGVGT